MDNQFKLLLTEYLDGDADATTVRQLCEMLKSDPARQKRFCEEMRLHTLLREIGRQKAANNIRALAQWPRRWKRAVMLPLAAAAVLVLGLYGLNVWQAQQAEKAVMGYVVDVNGMAARIQNGTPLQVGEIIHVGEAVKVGADGYVKFAYPDGSEIELSKNTQMSLGAARESRMFGLVQTCHGKWLKLDAGRLTAQMTKQPAGAPMHFGTPHAEIVVVGTKLAILVAAMETVLSVTQGAVDFVNRKGEFIRVRAGETRMLRDGVFADVATGVPTSHPIFDLQGHAGWANASVEPMVSNGIFTAAEPYVIAQFDFETPPDSNHFSGEQVERPEGGTADNRFCMRSVFGNAQFPVEAVNWHDWDTPLFVYDAGDEIELDYDLAVTAPWACVTICDNKSNRAYAMQLDRQTPGRWQHAKFRLSDFSAEHPGDGPIAPGLPVYSVIIQCPSGDGRCLYVDNLKVTMGAADAVRK